MSATVPVITDKDLDAESEYPIHGDVGCEILSRYRDESGQACLRITTEKPWGIESKEGLFEFDVLEKVVHVAPDRASI